MINEDTKLQTLYDYYKETVNFIKESNKNRDQLIVICLVLIAALFFQIVAPENSVETITSILSQKIGVSVVANASLISGIVWFALLIVAVRYFQTVIFAERQYDYVQQLEENLNSLYKGNFFTREGKSYLNKFPLFSDWVHTIYTIIFPTILIFLVIGKIIGEWHCIKGISAGLVFNTAISVLILITTCLCLLYIHWKK